MNIARLKVDLIRGWNLRELSVHLLNLSVEGRAVDLKKGGPTDNAV